MFENGILGEEMTRRTWWKRWSLGNTWGGVLWASKCLRLQLGGASLVGGKPSSLTQR